jgi:hypothetical protein
MNPSPDIALFIVDVENGETSEVFYGKHPCRSKSFIIVLEILLSFTFHGERKNPRPFPIGSGRGLVYK